mmetsp:Transcript_31714/g.87584  ORF Transcript_31714/g.87584 Transcript_31714/m.87584 type:complete len:267 (-) Transcript_31714:1283-2083(-)
MQHLVQNAAFDVRLLHFLLETGRRDDLEDLLGRGTFLAHVASRRHDDLNACLLLALRSDLRGEEQRLVLVELGKDRQGRTRMLVHVRVPRVVVHGLQQSLNATGVADRNLGRVANCERAQRVAAVHLHSYIARAVLHAADNGLWGALLDEVVADLCHAPEPGKHAHRMGLDWRALGMLAHGPECRLHASGLGDVRPALWVCRQVRDKVQPLCDEIRRGLALSPRASGLLDGVEDHRDALGLEDQVLGVCAPFRQGRQTTESALLHD